ncbi:protein kinase domain-containing protein [Streptomyces montanisoli]|uniref:non-specific serine/threonine protein kinase n=1 Tax=Streptomyces montanisoli TaxID=2798581 RepID=A0A940MAP2_9ACTN|nr:protein kinase [Streptomyces montanisoli]MBP0457453.1 serine/threonine protein kinase [Streptomyces montanisoli]
MAPEPEAGGGATPDAGDSWGIGGLVGDGRYRMTHRLGRGGMAEVFAAEDVRLGRTVAVKLLRSDLAEDPVAKARFTREAQSVAGLNHHAVVAVYDSGEDTVGGRTVPYIVMELVEGRTIRDLLLNAEAPPPEQALIIVSGVLEALAYSHQHGIVHRDIKPANVIITDSGAVKVMDFGIARALHGAQSTMTQTGMVMGTPQYLSPEQALGKAVDHRSDLYATGCLLYELLAQRPPFVGETPLSVVYQHVQDAPVPPSEVSNDCPPELDGLVMRSLAKEPEDRFQSAEEMRGLVQYGLQMLQQQGGFTGTWNTGAVLPQGPATTAALGNTGATAAMGAGAGYGQYGETAQRPMLPPINPEDGGYTGYNGAAGNGQRGARGKMLLFVALALVAIVGGVAFALNSMGNGDKKPDNQNPAPTVSQPHGSKLPAPTEDQTQDTGQPQDSTSGGDQGGSGYSTTHQKPTPSHSQDQKSSDSPTPSDTSTSGDGSTGGDQSPPPSSSPTTGGDSGDSGGSAGNGNGGTDAGTSAGNDNGGAGNGGSAGNANGGSANAGSAGAGPTGKAVAGTLGN